MNRLLKLQVIQSSPLFSLGTVKRKKKLRTYEHEKRMEKNWTKTMPARVSLIIFLQER